MRRMIIGLLLTVPAPVIGEPHLPSCPTPSAADVYSSGRLARALLAARTVKISKGEFETTATYQQRVAIAAKTVAPDRILTVLWPADGFKYDADTQTVTYPRYALDTGCTANPKDASYSIGRPICIEQDQTSTSHREVKFTAMGARAVVQVIHQNRVGLALGADQSRTIFGYETSDIFHFRATPDAARSLKAHGVFVLRGQPRPPFFLTASHYSEATLDSPVEIFGEDALLVFRLDCLSIADAKTGEVFATIPVNDPDERPETAAAASATPTHVLAPPVSAEDVRTGKIKIDD